MKREYGMLTNARDTGTIGSQHDRFAAMLILDAWLFGRQRRLK
jgi:hypothetical protein